MILNRGNSLMADCCRTTKGDSRTDLVIATLGAEFLERFPLHVAVVSPRETTFQAGRPVDGYVLAVRSSGPTVVYQRVISTDAAKMAAPNLRQDSYIHRGIHSADQLVESNDNILVHPADVMGRLSHGPGLSGKTVSRRLEMPIP